MARVRRPTAGPGRPKKWPEELVDLFLRVPKSYKERFDAERGPMSRTEYFVFVMDHTHKDIKEMGRRIAELEQMVAFLEKELEQKNKIIAQKDRIIERKDKTIEELEKLVQKLQEQLEKSGVIPAREREARDLRDEVQKVLSTYPELKLLELFRRLGYSEKGEALMKKAEAFQKRWFVLEGKVFVSRELGLVLEPSHEVGLLGWKVRKLEVNADV